MTTTNTAPPPKKRISLLMPIIGMTIFLTGQFTLIYLMQWQITRIDEKARQLTAIAEAEQSTILDLTQASAIDKKLWQDQPFRQAKLKGSWLASTPVRANVILPKDSQHQGAAFRLFAPFQTKDGVVIVDLGYTQNDKPPVPITASPPTVIEGRIWPNEKQSLFSLDDSRENGMMFTIDSHTAAAWMGVESTISGLIRLTKPAENLGEFSALNQTSITSIKPPNNHLGYAITWGMLAIIWAGMGLYWLISTRKHTKSLS